MFNVGVKSKSDSLSLNILTINVIVSIISSTKCHVTVISIFLLRYVVSELIEKYCEVMFLLLAP